MSDSLKCFSVLEVPAILFREISINYGTGKGSDREGYPSLRELDSKKIGFSGTIQLERICKADTFKIFSKQIDEHGGGIEILGVKPILFLKGVKQPITVSGVDPRWPKLLRFSQSETEFLNIASPEIKFLNWLLPIVTQLACGEISVEDIEWNSFEVAVKRRKVEWILSIIRMLFEECFTSRTGKQINYISTQIEGQVTYEIIRLAIAEFKGQRKDIMTYLENAPRKMLECSGEDFTLSQKAEAILKKMDKVYIQLSQERERNK
jgi:hypothetical protein